ncbi:MAG: hypothetical protein AAGI11_20740 [Pseudomonadota bacterium]
MYSKPDAPLSIGGVLDDGFRLAKASYVKLLLLAFVASLLGQLPNLAFVGDDPEALTEFPIQAAFVTLLSALISGVFYGAILARLGAITEGGDMSLIDALYVGMRRFPALIGCGICFIVVLSLGYILLVIPGIILTVSLGFAFYLVIIDKEGPISALKTSHRLVWGNWWRTTALITVIVFVSFVFVFIFGFVLGLAQVVLPPLIGVFLFALVGTLVYPVSYAMSLSVLNDLKLRKTGGDLASRMDDLGS